MTDYSENEINIVETTIERDLSVNVGYDLKWSGHVDRMVGKAIECLVCLRERLRAGTPGYGKIFS